MLKAFNRAPLLSRALSTTSSGANGEGPGAHAPHEEATLRPTEALAVQPEEGGPDGAESSIAPANPNPVFYGGILLRGQKNDLVRFFELPPTESLRGDFHCAMRKRVLLQGRMYVFDHYVCFYSAVFGFAKKRRIPMRTIHAVRKKTHLGFPNSLEIETDERKDFYTSFLSREEAYQLIQRLVPEAKRLAEENGDGATNDGSTNGASRAGAGQEGTSTQGGEGARPQGQGPRPSRPPHGSGVGGETLLTRGASGSMNDENDGDDASEEESRVWVVEQRPAPAVLSGSRHVLHSSLPGSPRDFFDVVLADSAPFLEDFLDSQGNRRINMTSWKRHPQLGHVRDLHFTAPIKGAFGNWGVSHTACSQTQRFCLYTEEHIVFESSQTMTDIPYGDCFTVDQRWDIRRDPMSDPDKPQIAFDLHVRVPFTSRCLFKGVIESGSVKQVQETYAQFVEQLRPVMQERMLSRNTLHLHDVDGGGLAGPVPSHTPRIGSVSASAQRPPLGRLASLRTSNPMASSMARIASMQSQHAFDDGDSPDGLPGSVAGGRRDPGVGRLLLSLGRRLGEGARGLLFDGVDVVLNLARCQCTPQMRALVAIVILMFLANLACMAVNFWPSAASPASPASVAAPPAPAVLLPGFAGGGAAFAGLGGGDVGLGEGLGGAGGAGGGYWGQRMAVLQQELQLLQGRLELVLKEVTLVHAHLAAGAAPAAGVDAGGGAATTAAAGGREL